MEPSQQYLAYIRERAKQLRAADKPPASLKEWTAHKVELRKWLLASWGGFPERPCDLQPQKLGELQRDGYRVEKIVFQTRPGVQMTANAYVPAGEGKRPAVLCVHGHWRGAKQDPVPQSRCIGLAKLGFFVMAVDAFGAGERGIGKQLGQYHGEMTGSTLWPAGLPLSGQQVYENMRAVDYLLTRPEVDGTKLGITGASGGGNQTMYAGAFDERFSCVVPVCSVGTYQAYLGAACCVCEVVPDVLLYTEEWGLLAMVAPRALMVINATKDAFQFSVGEAEKSIAGAKPVFQLYGHEPRLKHAIFESPHDYNGAMREAMYGWMTLHLKGEGTGEPIPEPQIKTEDPETLRCWPGESRPESFVTLPMFAAAESQKIVAKHNAAKLEHAEHWESESERLRYALLKKVLGGFPQRSTPPVRVEEAGGWLIGSEPGIEITAIHRKGKRDDPKLAIVLDLDGSAHASESEAVKSLSAAGWDLLLTDLRATGPYAVPGDKIGAAVDHNSAEWGTLTGRPLLGQWIWDVRMILDVLISREPDLARNTTLIGLGPAGVVALTAAALEPRILRVAAVGMLSTLVSAAPYTHGRMGILAPRLLRDVGDIPRLAALVAPRPLIIAGSLKADGQPLGEDDRAHGFTAAQEVYRLLKAESKLSLIAGGAGWIEKL